MSLCCHVFALLLNKAKTPSLVFKLKLDSAFRSESIFFFLQLLFNLFPKLRFHFFHIRCWRRRLWDGLCIIIIFIITLRGFEFMILFRLTKNKIKLTVRNFVEIESLSDQLGNNVFLGNGERVKFFVFGQLVLYFFY